MSKRKLLLLLLFAICVIVAVVYAYRPQTQPDGFGGVRYPTVSLPPSVSVEQYYNAELDMICLIFTKKFTGPPYYDIDVPCFPRSQTDY